MTNLFVKRFAWKVCLCYFYLPKLALDLSVCCINVDIHAFFSMSKIHSGTTLCMYTVVCYQTNTLEKWRGWKMHKCGFHNFNKLWTIPINSWEEWEYFIFYKQPPPPLNVKSNSQPRRLIQNHKSHTMISFLINLSTSF